MAFFSAAFKPEALFLLSPVRPLPESVRGRRVILRSSCIVNGQFSAYGIDATEERNPLN